MGDFFQGGSYCRIKNKLKSNNKRQKQFLYKRKYFSVITKNSNWEIFPKNLGTFKK